MNLKKWSLIAFLLLASGVVLGLASPSGLTELLQKDLAALKELGASMTPFKLSTALFIFAKNVTALLMSFLLSPILWLMPVLTLVVNGWLIGFVATTVVAQKSVIYLLAGILPHGIFELPALVIGGAAALSFSTHLIFSLFSSKWRGQLWSGFKESLSYLGIAFLLLIPAAIMETFVTPFLIAKLGS